MPSLLEQCIIQAYFLHRSARLDVLNVIMQKYIIFVNILSKYEENTCWVAIPHKLNVHVHSSFIEEQSNSNSVSYTHLTLPTILRV